MVVHLTDVSQQMLLKFCIWSRRQWSCITFSCIIWLLIVINIWLQVAVHTVYITQRHRSGRHPNWFPLHLHFSNQLHLPSMRHPCVRFMGVNRILNIQIQLDTDPSQIQWFWIRIQTESTDFGRSRIQIQTWIQHDCLKSVFIVLFYLPEN